MNVSFEPNETRVIGNDLLLFQNRAIILRPLYNIRLLFTILIEAPITLIYEAFY